MTGPHVDDGGGADTTSVAVELEFRRQYSLLVARLARKVGFHHTERVEEAVQSALMAALATWPRRGRPERPTAWLYRVASNHLLGELRRRPTRTETRDVAEGELANIADEAGDIDHVRFGSEIADDELRLLFVCADERIPPESQIVLALKVLCGFSTREIALRLLTSEENVQKRLSRGRARLRELDVALDASEAVPEPSRCAAVLRIVYLLFNEGYSSVAADRLLRRELCDEAIRLVQLLLAHPRYASPEAAALLALMLLHVARFDTRIDGHGGLVLLEDQDRSRWNRELIGLGVHWLGRSASGDTFSRYHAEAAVAAAHCMAPSFEATDWPAIVELYAILERHEPSPLHTLNRAIAMAQWQGPEAGLAVLEALKPPTWLAGYYLWDATLGELQRRAGRPDVARRHLRRALELAPHPAEKALIARRLAACE